jgi:hypothetical protein
MQAIEARIKLPAVVQTSIGTKTAAVITAK